MLIISNKSSDHFKEFLDSKKIEYILTIDNENLDKRVADHPDLSIFVKKDKSLIIDKSVSNYYKKLLPDKNIIEGDMVANKYPNDAIYNVYHTGKFYIHNDITEKNIKAYLEKEKLKHIYVKQGYTRCLIVPMKDLFLTSDYGIYKKSKSKANVRLIPEDKIDLDGFSKGFLGGCCGIYRGDLLFNGDIENLSSFKAIKEASQLTGTRLIYPKGKLLDTGSILEI